MLESAWKAIYGKVLSDGLRSKHGVRAEAEFATRHADEFVIVPFLGQRRPTAAYSCRGALLPLGEFCTIDFFVAPPDFEWTMIHTHEDYGFGGMGGPYFIEREWIVVEPAAPRRTDPRRRHQRRR